MPTDLVIENTTIVTMNAKREVLSNASNAISGEKIAAIGEGEGIRAQYSQAQFIDGREEAHEETWRSIVGIDEIQRQNWFIRVLRGWRI